MATQNPNVTNYYQTIESRLGYGWWLKGVRHFGYYPEGANNLSFAQAQLLMNEQLALRLSSLPPYSHILDAGCGEGGVAIYLAKHKSFHISGVDLIEANVRKALKEVEQQNLAELVNIEKADYEDLPFPDQSFEAIYTMETLVHAKHYNQALQEFHRILKPHGLYVMFEYSIAPDNQLTRQQRQNLAQIAIGSAMHSLPYFRHDTIRALIERQGFTIVSINDISARIMPMLKVFHHVGLIPYSIARLFHQQHHIINAMAGVEGYRLFAKDAWKFWIIVVQKG